LPHGEKSFLVAFPNVETLRSMVDIGYQLKHHGVTITISEWQIDQDIVPAYELDEVWVHITNVPHKYRHFLVFWALGQEIGSTRDVDMFTYRKQGIIRVKVAVVNNSFLPITTDLVFGNIGYNITFTLDSKEFIPAVPSPLAPDYMDQDGPGSDRGNDEDDKEPSAAKKMRGDVQFKDSNINQGQQAGNGSEPL
jgi:hypothetical protein